MSDVTMAELTYEQSASIGKISEALASAQEEMGNAAKDSTNPHYNSKFADLASVREAARPLAKHKIALSQWPQSRADGSAGVRTVLSHSSGEWMAATAWVKPQQAGPQAFGSVVTYLRRYSLGAAAGIASDDDDGNAAEGNGRARGGQPPAPKAQAAKSAPPSAPAVALATPPQVTALNVAITKLGITDRGGKLRWISDAVARVVTSSKELTVDECTSLIQRAKDGEVGRSREPGEEG